jgi:hypothetical protein
MAELKTRPTGQDVVAFLKAVPDEKKRRDCFTLLDLMRETAQAEPAMWGDSIVGFGSYHYRYESGRQGDWFLTGFSPRKQNLTLYIMSGFDQYDDLLARLGRHTIGKSCLYIKRLEDIDLPVLEELVRLSVAHLAGDSRNTVSKGTV